MAGLLARRGVSGLLFVVLAQLSETKPAEPLKLRELHLHF